MTSALRRLDLKLSEARIKADLLIAQIRLCLARFPSGARFDQKLWKTAAREAPRTIGILSPAYLTSKFAKSEWSAARDPGNLRRLFSAIKQLCPTNTTIRRARASAATSSASRVLPT